MLDLLLDAVMDILKTLPILLVVYALLSVLENKLKTTPALLSKTAQFGPVCGALAGAIPQCGFSAAASALYLDGYLAPATLIAVFLATSDEAIPILLASPNGVRDTILLLVCKTILAVVGGYFLLATVFRRKIRFDEPIEVEMEDCGCGSAGLFPSVLWRTAKTAVFLVVILLMVNLAVYFVGEDRLSALLLGGTIFQPIICATIGLIPSCAISVLLTELYVSGTIGFGSLIAGLSTGAGFGYIILLSDRSKRKKAYAIIAATWVLAVIGGIVTQYILV